jgi:hypothetical protein
VLVQRFGDIVGFRRPAHSASMEDNDRAGDFLDRHQTRRNAVFRARHTSGHLRRRSGPHWGRLAHRAGTTRRLTDRESRLRHFSSERLPGRVAPREADDSVNSVPLWHQPRSSAARSHRPRSAAAS